MSRFDAFIGGSRAIFLSISRFVLGLPSRPRRLGRLSWLLRSEESNWRFAGACALIFSSYLIWAHAHHLPWRDEAHPWLLARQADGFWDILMGDRRYDGHPPGWYWTLWLASFVTRDVWGMHATTIIVASLAVLSFLRFAPFPRLVRLVLVAGYPISFEYSVLSRNYDLGLLFAFAFAGLLKPLRPRPVLLATMLAGLALSSVYGLIMAGALSCILLAESSRIRTVQAMPGLLSLVLERRALFAFVLVLGVMGISLWSSHPPDPNAAIDAVHWERVNLQGWEAALQRVTWTTLPLRIDGDPAFWYAHSQVWDDHPGLFNVACWGLLAVMALSLMPHPVEAVAFVLGAAGFAVVQMTLYMGGVRHWGHTFILFLVVCWTARRRKPLRRSGLVPVALFIIGLFQCQAAWVAIRTSARIPFSSGILVAERLEEPDLVDLPLVGGPDALMPAVMVHLDRTFISCETDEWNQTLLFHARRRYCTPGALLNKAISVSREHDGPVSLVSIFPVPGAGSAAQVELLLATPKPTLTPEDYFVYRVTAR